MANKKNSEVVSKVLASAIRTVFEEHVEKGDMTTCVSAATLAADKRIAKAFTVAHPKTLETLVKAAASGGQLNGISIRKGFAGGLFRVAAKKAVKKAVKEAPVIEASAEVTV